MLKKREEEKKKVIKRKYVKNQEKSNKVVNKDRIYRINQRKQFVK